MSTPIVLQIQEEALDSSRSLSDLLRKAMVVATKLELEELKTWLDRELNAYNAGDDVPPYRMLHGQLKGWNPYHGWVPVGFEDASVAEKLSSIPCIQSVPELEDLLSRSDGGQLTVPAGTNLTNQLNRAGGPPTHYMTFISGASVANILSAVRNAVLNWALRLERDGIVGDGISFSAEEQTVAQDQQYNINNFYGPVSQANIQQASPGSMQVGLSLPQVRKLLDAVTEQLPGLDLREDAVAEAHAEIATVRAQLESPRPKESVIRGALGVVRRILEEATGGAAGALIVEIAKALGN